MTRRLPLLLIALFSLVSAASAFAAFPQLETKPAHPLAGTPVTVVVGFLCPELKLKRVNGHVIELETVNAVCLSAGIPGQQSFDVGPLEAGTYEVIWVGPPDTSLGTFEVTAVAADVPALDSRGMWMLALVILCLGVFGIGRATS